MYYTRHRVTEYLVLFRNPHSDSACLMKSGTVSKSNAKLHRFWSKNDTKKKVCGLVFDKLFDTERILNHRLIGETIFSKNSFSLNDCLIYCGFELNSICQAVTFNELTQYCYFYKNDLIMNYTEEENYTSVYLTPKSINFKFCILNNYF